MIGVIVPTITKLSTIRNEKFCERVTFTLVFENYRTKSFRAQAYKFDGSSGNSGETTLYTGMDCSLNALFLMLYRYSTLTKSPIYNNLWLYQTYVPPVTQPVVQAQLKPVVHIYVPPVCVGPSCAPKYSKPIVNQPTVLAAWVNINGIDVLTQFSSQVVQWGNSTRTIVTAVPVQNLNPYGGRPLVGLQLQRAQSDMAGAV